MEFLFYEGKQEINDQVVLIIINMEHSSLENQKQQFKMQPHFGIFDTVIGEGQ